MSQGLQIASLAVHQVLVQRSQPHEPFLPPGALFSCVLYSLLIFHSLLPVWLFFMAGHIFYSFLDNRLQEGLAYPGPRTVPTLKRLLINRCWTNKVVCGWTCCMLWPHTAYLLRAILRSRCRVKSWWLFSEEWGCGQCQTLLRAFASMPTNVSAAIPVLQNH